MKPQHYHHAMPAPDACIDQCDGQYMKLIALAQCSCVVGVGGGSATRPNLQIFIFFILSITRSTDRKVSRYSDKSRCDICNIVDANLN